MLVALWGGYVQRLRGRAQRTKITLGICTSQTLPNSTLRICAFYGIKIVS